MHLQLLYEVLDSCLNEQSEINLIVILMKNEIYMVTAANTNPFKLNICPDEVARIISNCETDQRG